MTYKATWARPLNDLSGESIPGSLALTYHYRDSNGQVYTGSGLETPDYTEPNYGTLITGHLHISAAGYVDSASISRQLRINRSPIVTGMQVTILSNVNPASVQAQMSVDEVDVSLNPLVLLGIWSARDTGATVEQNGLVTIARPSTGWPGVGGIVSKTIRYSDQYGLHDDGEASVRVVAPINNPPTPPENITFTLRQGESNDFALGDYAIDPDSGDTVRFSEGAEFQIPDVTLSIINNGLTLRVEATTDAPVGSHPIDMIAEDNHGATADTSGWAIQITSGTRMGSARDFNMELS